MRNTWPTSTVAECARISELCYATHCSVQANAAGSCEHKYVLGRPRTDIVFPFVCNVRLSAGQYQAETCCRNYNIPASCVVSECIKDLNESEDMQLAFLKLCTRNYSKVLTGKLREIACKMMCLERSLEFNECNN